MMEKELVAQLTEAGIDVKELKTALAVFLQNKDCWDVLAQNADSLLLYMKKEAIEEFLKILRKGTSAGTPAAPLSDQADKKNTPE